MALVPGSRLGRYQIVRLLGAGAMGEVYLAEDPQIERQLAIKTVRLELVDQEPQLRLRIEREAKAAGRLVHPHIVTLFDAGEADGVFFLAFEFIDGSDLAARARRQPPLTIAEILRIGREAASALDAAHRVGIIHRDIKPSNMMLSPDGSLKIGDFGIATILGTGTHLTQTGSMVGTPQYLSPEQVKNELPLDGRSDLFALGVVLYELLAGRRPFEGASLPGLLYAIAMADPFPIQQMRPDLPPRLSAAVMRLLAKDPADRFPTAGAFGEELAAIEREEIYGAAPTSPGTTLVGRKPADETPTIRLETTAPKRRVGLIASLAVAALVAVGAIGAAVSYYFNDPPTPIEEGAGAGPVQPATTTTAPEPPPVKITETGDTRESVPAETSLDVAAAGDEPLPLARPVGGAVIFRVSPADAVAIARIDGLVRGPARSLLLLRPGRHQIDIIAEGYEPARLVVESRPERGTTEIDVRLEPR